MVQEVTTQSWFSRIGGAFAGILVGIALIFGSFFLIFWNEGQGLRTTQSLQQAQSAVIAVKNAPIDSANNLKLVYFTGQARTDETLTDPILGISAKAIRLKRIVSIYQWKEKSETKTESELGGSEKKTTTYTYVPVWSSSLLDSSQFKEAATHKNPTRKPIPSMTMAAKKVMVGDFILPPELSEKISVKTSVDLSEINSATLVSKTNLKVHVDNTDIYLGEDVQNPQIGDAKIQLIQILPQTVSVIAQQVDSTLEAYLAPAGKPIEMLVSGQQSSAQMFNDAQHENALLMWIMRLISLVLMISAIALILRPIVVLADVVPLFGSIVGFGTGFIAFLVGLFLWTIGTAIAWFFVRPLFAIALVFLVGLTGYYCLIRRRKSIPKT
jgi:hypothetical protein